MTPGPYRPGQVLTAFVPFKDRDEGKVRPVLVISKPAYNARTGQVIALGITSHPAPFGDYAALDYRSVGLDRPCNVILDTIITIEDRYIQRAVGSVDARLLQRATTTAHAHIA